MFSVDLLIGLGADEDAWAGMPMGGSIGADLLALGHRFFGGVLVEGVT